MATLAAIVTASIGGTWWGSVAAPWAGVALLGNVDMGRWESMTRGFRHRTSSAGEAYAFLFVMLACAVLVWAATQWFNGGGSRRSYSSPWRLFFELCQAHRLSWSRRWLLWRLARSHALKHPARLFLEPEFLRPRSLPPTLRGHAATFAQLEQLLFAESEGLTTSTLEAETDSDAPGETESAPAGPTPLLSIPRSPGLDLPPWNEPIVTGPSSS
ncbi:MAG: hypothetical protein ACOY3P_26020 [Planctomycetota bacterium]